MPNAAAHASAQSGIAPNRRRWRIVHSECSTGWGGQEHRVLAELAGFQKRQCPVWLFAPTASGIWKRARATGVETIPITGAKLRFAPQVIHLSRWLRAHQIEVVNTHSSRDGWIVGMAARMARTPFLVRSRHIDVDYPNPWLSRHAYVTLADHVLTTSQRITEHFQRIFHLPDNRISTVPTGIDTTRFRPEGPKAPLHRAGGSVARPVLGMVSVLRSWKGHSVFLHALKLLAQRELEFEAVIVGEGPIRSQVESLIREHNLGNRVQMMGHREDVDAVLRGLDILVIPSTAHEGVPQIGMQAMACGTPVVGSDTGGIPEIIRPGRTGRIFPSGNAEALAAALTEALNESAKTRALAAAAVEEARHSHSIEGMLDTLDALYARHLGAATP